LCVENFLKKTIVRKLLKNAQVASKITKQIVLECNALNCHRHDQNSWSCETLQLLP